MIFNIKNNEFLYKKVILTKKECSIITNFILKNENNIKNLGPDIYYGTSDDSLTGRFYLFNYLNSEEINHILIPKIKKICNKLKLKFPIYVQCWGNTYRIGDYIEPHTHSNANSKKFISCNIFLGGNNIPGTTYYFNGGKTKKDIKNKVGEICVFNSNLMHEVKPYNGTDVRISMAMDIMTNDQFHQEFETNPARYYKIS